MRIENNMVDVSVIVPCYNAEKYLELTLKSLENQTFKNFEVIMIDDGSVDRTKKIIEKYINRKRIQIMYKYQKNSGVSRARNQGLEYANGEYIIFLDSDDVYGKRYIEYLFNEVKKDNIDVAYCTYSRNVEKILKNEKNNVEEKKILNHMELMNKFMYREGPCNFWCYIYKKSIIEDNRIKFNEELKYGEDTQFTWKFLSKCNNGVFINEKLYGYRDNEYSVVNNINWRLVDTLKSVIEVEKYLEQNKDMFSDKFSNYMKCRSTWAIAKDFSKCGKKDLYDKFIKEYSIKPEMKKVIKETNNIWIKGSSMIYCINSKMFYYLIKIVHKKKIGE